MFLGVPLWLALTFGGAVAATSVITAVVNVNGSDSRWSRSVEDNFLSSCSASSGGYTSICECVLHKLESRYSEQEFAALEGQTAATGQLPAEFQAAAKQCE